MKKLLLLMLPLFFMGCESEDKSVVYNENNTTVIDGVVYDIYEKPIDGLYKIYYPNGSVKMEIESQNGLPEGNGKFYDENSMLIAEGNFVKGSLDGAMRRYYENGKIREELNYEKGILTGLQKSYDEKGNLFMEVEYKAGKAIRGYAIIKDKKVDLSEEELKNF